MRCFAKDVVGHEMHAKDGNIGQISDFYFDDQTWTIRYFVAETGNWLFGRKVLLSPSVVLGPDFTDRIFVDLEKKQIEESPQVPEELDGLMTAHESLLSEHYAWPMYSPSLAGGPIMNVDEAKDEMEKAERDDQIRATRAATRPSAHLKSANEVLGYHIHATDETLGHIENWVFSTKDWQITYAVVDTQNWWPGKRVLLSPKWIKSVDWNKREVFVIHSSEVIREAPSFDNTIPISDEYEQALERYYRNASSD